MMIRRDPEDPRLTRVQSRQELIEQQWSDRALARARASGMLVRPRRGWYVEGEAWRRLDDNGRHEVVCRAAVAGARTGVSISHLSSLAFFETPTWGLQRPVVDLTRRDRRAGRAEAGIRQHRGVLLAGDTVEISGITVTSPTRAALEATTQLGLEAALVQLCDLLHRKLTTPEALSERYATSMGHWPGSLHTSLCLRLADPRIESVGEARTLFLCHQQALPMPEPQVEIVDHRGKSLGRVDFAWREHKVFLEFDGKVKYTKLLKEGQDVTDVVLAEKRRESAIVRATGWRCIRLTWADLAHPERTARMIFDMLRGVA